MDNFKRLIDAIREGISGVYFNMAIWNSPPEMVLSGADNLAVAKAKEEALNTHCGTMACIGGHAEIMKIHPGSFATQDQWDAITHPDMYPHMGHLTNKQVADFLEFKVMPRMPNITGHAIQELWEQEFIL